MSSYAPSKRSSAPQTHQTPYASLVQREVAHRRCDGGIVCTYCRFINPAKGQAVLQSLTRFAGAPFAQGSLFYLGFAGAATHKGVFSSFASWMLSSRKGVFSGKARYISQASILRPAYLMENLHSIPSTLYLYCAPPSFTARSYSSASLFHVRLSTIPVHSSPTTR